MKTDSRQLFDPAAVAAALELILEPGQVTELRILDGQKHTDRGDWECVYVGYFDDHAKLIEALGQFKSAKGVYVIPNPIDHALLARASNRLKRGKKGDATQDTCITSRRWLLIDADAVRPSGISASDSEHAAALDLARSIYAHLKSQGWPEPIAADSGNGGHLLYRIELPTADDCLVERCLEALAARFTGDAVKVDKGVFNPARIWKLYGTVAGKGDSTADRPHRMAKILNAPETLEAVPNELLHQLADEIQQPETTKPKSRDAPQASRSDQTFDLHGFIQRNHLDVDGPHHWNSKLGPGHKWTFNTSPLCEHHDDGPHVAMLANGAITAGCHHDSCSWDWAELRAKYEPKPSQTAGNGNGSPESEHDSERPLPTWQNYSQLRAAYPHLRDYVIDGICREGETVNIIAASKQGKSWLSVDLAMSVAVGQPWLGFNTSRGKVLLIDNELHAETLSSRVFSVRHAREHDENELADSFFTIPMRGNVCDLIRLGALFSQIRSGQFKVIILDAFYRFIPPGYSENENQHMMNLYNILDRHAARIRCCFIVIHHASKGAQGDKLVTDVGSGAGSMSRACDTHMIIRPHETGGYAVMDVALRSFKPIEPQSLYFQHPVWEQSDLEPKVKTNQSARAAAKEERDREMLDEIVASFAKREHFTTYDVRDQLAVSSEPARRLVRLGVRKGFWSQCGSVLNRNKTESPIFRVTTSDEKNV